MRSVDSRVVGPTPDLMDQMIQAGANVIDHWAKDVRDGWVSAQEVAPLVWSAMIQPRQRLQKKLFDLEACGGDGLESIQGKVFAINSARIGRDSIMRP